MGLFHRSVFHLKHDVSVTEFCLCLQAETTQLDPIDRDEDRDRIQSPKHSVANKNRTMDNV
jgi:hypothetical protein